MSIETVFIAGVMQGSRSDGSISDQLYRERIVEEVRRVFPNATCIDPAAPTTELLGSLSDSSAIPERISQTLESGLADLASDFADVRLVSSTFMEATALAAQCSVCIAYLPGLELSMGTGMEMYAARAAGKPVITITENTSNLAILATSDVLVSDIAHLPSALVRIAATVGDLT